MLRGTNRSVRALKWLLGDFVGYRMIRPLPIAEQEILDPLPAPGSMLELGNKHNLSVKRRGEDGIYKHWFQTLGWKHVSVDINGEDGALPLDLTQDQDLGRFDVVTNFGTTEHIGDDIAQQRVAWGNIHRACAGLFASVTPLPGDWPRHGRWYPTRTFFEGLQWLDIERIYKAGIRGRRCWYVRATANGQPFNFSAEHVFDNHSENSHFPG